jgi:hypothetical protein
MDKEVAGAHNALRCVHTKTAQELWSQPQWENYFKADAV